MRSQKYVNWLAVFLSILCSTFRALNLGYQAKTYWISAGMQIVFLFQFKELSQRILNSFYLITNIIGALRWTYNIQ